MCGERQIFNMYSCVHFGLLLVLYVLLQHLFQMVVTYQHLSMSCLVLLGYFCWLP